ncbi:MAG: hypothetical protein U0931_13190 [Vulcanimicrobiota bacterium]
MKRRGVTIIAILLMLVVLATLVGALAIAGSGTLNGQFVATRGEEARRAAEAGAQAAIANIQAATSPVPGWLYSPTSVAPVPWQKMETVDSEYQVLHVDHTAAPANPDWILPGNPATGTLPTVVPNGAPPANAIAEVPAGANLHYLYSTGRTRSGHYRSIGVLYTTAPGVKILSWQVF